MPLGDSDIGIFFGEFGVPVVYGPQSTTGLLDTPSASQSFGGSVMEKGEAAVKIATTALNPMPKTRDTITVAGLTYAVQERTVLDDGAITELKLKGPQSA